QRRCKASAACRSARSGQAAADRWPREGDRNDGIAMTVAAVSPSPCTDLPLPRAFWLGFIALCIGHGMYLVASLAQGQWLSDPNGQPIATDFVNVWAAGRQTLAGEPAAVYDVALHKIAEVAAVGHAFDGEYPWLYPPTFLFVALSLAFL